MKIFTSNICFFSAVMLGTFFTAIQPAHGDTWAWTGGGTADEPVTGNWSVPGNWAPDTVPDSANDTVLQFGGISGADLYISTLDLGAASDTFTLNQLNLNWNGTGRAELHRTDSRTLTMAGANPGITHNSASDVEIHVPVNFDHLTIDGNGGGVLRFRAGGGLSGNTLTKNGSGGVMIDRNPNGFLNVNHLIINDGRFGLSSAGGTNQNTSMTVEVYGNGEFGQWGVGDDLTYGGVSGDGTLINSTSQTRSHNINVADGERHEFTGSATAGRIASINIGGDGTQAFGQGTNITRPVNVSGDLELSGTVTGAGTTTIQNGGNLSGTGTWNRNFVVESGGTLDPGNSIGTLTLGNLALNDNFIYNWEFDENDSDLVAVLSELTLSDFGTINAISLDGSSAQAGSILFSADSFSGATNLSGWTVNGSELQVGIDGNNIVLIPEPSTLLLLGIALGGLLKMRRIQ